MRLALIPTAPDHPAIEREKEMPDDDAPTEDGKILSSSHIGRCVVSGGDMTDVPAK